MRNKAQIKKLDEVLAAAEPGKGGPPLPQRPDYVWQTRSAMIRDLLQENNLGGDWSWDEESATFFAEWTAGDGFVLEQTAPSGARAGSGFYRLNVTFDPRLGVENEIRRLRALADTFTAEATVLSAAIRKAYTALGRSS